MFLSRALIAGVAAVACLTVSPALSVTQVQTNCDGGPAGGLWRLPEGTFGTGVASGRLLDRATQQTEYRLRALLTDEPTPCLSCLQGTIKGTLDDGVGSSPDFLVEGRYSGFFLAGTGTFQVRVFRPGTSTAVGTLTGSFADTHGDGSPGRFLGEWRICP